MLNNDRVAEVIGNITYKPGWSFTTEYWLSQAVRPMLHATATVLHSVTLQPVTFTIQRLVPTCARFTEAALVDWVKDMCHEAEYHELREFFKYKGELWDNPHESTPVGSTT